ncbi:hypothetical protein D3C80_1845700 [compost metagenome]
MIVNVDVLFLIGVTVLVIFKLLNTTEPTAGPWPGSADSLAQMPTPDLASKASPLFWAPEMVMLVKMVSATGNCGAEPA